MDSERLMQEIQDAQMILVGLGEEFDKVEFGKAEVYKGEFGKAEVYKGELGQAEFVKPGFEEDVNMAEAVLREEGIAWMIPFVRDCVDGIPVGKMEAWDEMGNNTLREEAKKALDEKTEKTFGNRKRKALGRLAEVLEGKNYFVVSKAQASVIAEIPWREGRLVTPCGNSLQKQCEVACENSEIERLTEEESKGLQAAAVEFLTQIDPEQGTERSTENWSVLPEEVRRAMEMIQKKERIQGAALALKKKASEVLGRCSCCGASKSLNVFQCQHYDERGYLKDWERYTKWLAGSMNRKLLLLELGCDERRPEVIRKPFEKIAELNLKSKYISVGQNSSGEGDDERKRAIGKNVIDWLLKL